ERADSNVPNIGCSLAKYTNDRAYAIRTIVHTLGAMSMIIEDGRRARGDASRRLVLGHAADIASVDGLDGLTIGRLAEASVRRKSSVAALFGGKEGLRMATVADAAEVFTADGVAPARDEPRGARRVAALLQAALAYSGERVFSGGCCFMASAA